MLTFHESTDPGCVSLANDYLEDRGYNSLKCTTGYYADREFAEQIFEPALLTVRTECPACANPERTNDCADCETCDGSGDVFTYFPGYRCDDYHGKQEGVFDMENGFTDTEEAARAAHGIAAREAEKESEYQEKERARTLAQEELPEQIQTARQRHSKLIGAITKYRDGSFDDATCTYDRATLRAGVTRDVKRIRELRSQFDFTKE